MLRASQRDVKCFLERVRACIAEGRWTFPQREKNMATLMQLGLRPADVKEEVLRLTLANYCLGPEPSKDGRPGDVWSFRLFVRKKPIYIKLALSARRVICISFHDPEYPQHCPYA